MGLFSWSARAAPSSALSVPADGVKAEAMKSDELERLIKTLENDTERKVLIDQMKSLVQVQRQISPSEDGRFFSNVAARVESMVNEVVNTAGALKHFPRLLIWLELQVSTPESRLHWAEILGKLAVVLALGLVASHLLTWALRRPERMLEPREPITPLMRIPLAVARAILRLIPVAGFFAVSNGVLIFIALSGSTMNAANLLLTAFIGVRLVMVAAFLVLAPRTAALRLIPVSDETAEYLVIWIRRLVSVGMYGFFSANAASILGLPAGGHLFVTKAVGLSLVVMAVIFILQNRQAVAAWLRGHRASLPFGRQIQGVKNRLADVWHILASIYVIAVYLVWAMQVEGGFEFMIRASVLTVVILVVATVLSAGARRLIVRGFSIGQDVRERFPLMEIRANRYLPLLQLVFRMTLLVFTVLALAQAWGMDSLGMLSSETGLRILSSLLSIATVLIGALIFWEITSGAIERYLRATDREGNRIQRSSRARTLLPLARNVLMVVLVVMVSLIILSELGVNIAPLLAGAGVVGVAIGFGSQKLVQDVITGAFILFEDTMSVGDSVTLNNNSGTVETMSIRAIRLRDGSGSLHTIPFSALGTIVNMSREFGFAVFEVTVAYQEDPDRIMDLLRDLGEEIQKDPLFSLYIVEPLDIWGVERFDATSLVIKARFKTLPTKQSTVMREFQRRMKKRFEAEEVEMPNPKTMVYTAKGPRKTRVRRLGAANEGEAAPQPS